MWIFFRNMLGFMLLEAVILSGILLPWVTRNELVLTFARTSPWMLLYYGFFAAIFAYGMQERK